MSVTTTVLPLADYPDQTTAWGPVAIADTVTLVSVQIQRDTPSTPTIWPNASTVVGLSIERSMDGGQTWGGRASFSSPGGVAFDDSGNPVPQAFMSFPVPPGTNRKLQGVFSIAGGPLHSTMSITVT